MNKHDAPHPNRNLGAMIGSRICHDLISPVGAMANGMELLTLSGVPDSPEMAMMRASAGGANARLLFCRIAFGLSNTGQTVAPDAAARIFAGIYTQRTQVDWGLNAPLRRDRAQAAFLAVLCAETAVPYGGTISVTGDEYQLIITARGDRLAEPSPQWTDLAQGTETAEITPATVQFRLLPDLLTDHGTRAEVTWSENEVVLTI